MTREDYIRKLMDIQELCAEVVRFAAESGQGQCAAEDMAEGILTITRA